MTDRTIPSELTLCINGVDIHFTVDPDVSYRSYGANCDVFAASSRNGEFVIIKMFRSQEKRPRELEITQKLFEKYGQARGNYFMGICQEANGGDGQFPYCHVFQRVNGRPLHETVARSCQRDHYSLVRILQTFLGFLEGMVLLHKLGYAHLDLNPSNIYAFQATAWDSLIIQPIDFDTAVDKTGFPTKTAARERFYLLEKARRPWYNPTEIRQARELLTEDNALAQAQALDVLACARILAYMLFAPERPVPMSLDEINRRLRSASMDLGTKNALRRFFRRALHEDPAERFATCADMRTYLKQVLEGADENREVTSLYAVRIRLGNHDSKEANDFYEKLDTDILSEFRDDKRSYASLREVLADTPSCTLITGEGGIGKTYALKNEYYRRLYARDENSDIALYVELKGMKTVGDITAKLDERRRNLRATGLRVPYSVFLDAFDESLMDRDESKDKSKDKRKGKDQDTGDGPDEFLSYLSKLQDECRVVVTCRHRIKPTQSGPRENTVFSSVVSTAGLRDEQIERYLEKKRLDPDVQNQNTALVQLLKNPLMLSLFVEMWKQTAASEGRTELLRIANEVELVDKYFLKQFTVRSTEDFHEEEFRKGLAAIARCSYDHRGLLSDMKSEQDLIKKTLRKLRPIVSLSENGRIVYSHQVFEDVVSSIAFSEHFMPLYQEAKKYSGRRKGIPVEVIRKTYAKKLEAIDKMYDRKSDNVLRFRGIRIAMAEPDTSGDLYTRLESRTDTVFEHIDWLSRWEKRIWGIIGVLVPLLVFFSNPLLGPNRELFGAVAAIPPFWQGLLLFLPAILFGGPFALFYDTLLSRTFVTVSNQLFSIRCHCQRYGDGEVCVMPPTVSECRDAMLDPRCKKLILGRDYSGEYGNFFSEAMALEEVDCSHNRRYRFEGGCLYYKSRRLAFVVSPKDTGLYHIHIPQGVVLREITHVAFGGGARFVQLSGTGRFRQGVLCDLFYAREYAYFHGIIFNGTQAQWRRMSKSGDPFSPTKKQYEYWKANDIDIEDSGFRFLNEQGFDTSSFELSPKEAETLKNGIIPEKSWVYFTQGEPNISQTVNDTIIPIKAYMGSTKFVNLSCPVAEVVNRGAFAFSTVREVKLPACVTVGAGAFYYAGGLACIECPRVETIEREAFASTVVMQSVSLPSCKQIENFAFAASGISKICIPLAERLGTGALSFCQIMTMHLPNCAWIGEGALACNDKLCEVTLSNKLKSLGRWAFKGSHNLTKITFEGTVAEWQAVEKEGAICDHPLLIRCSDGDWTEIPHINE